MGFHCTSLKVGGGGAGGGGGGILYQRPQWAGPGDEH